MTLRNFPPADQCEPEDLDAIADLVVSDPRASYDLAGSREHIEALCRRYRALAQDLAAAETLIDRMSAGSAALERDLARTANDLDAARTEIRARELDDQQELDAELAAHPEPGPLHHARDHRDHREDTTP